MNKIIWTNGCFDVLHVGHIEMLKYAKSLGDILIVGIDSDRRVKSLKGSNRPINNENDRKKMLESIRYVDEVKIFDSEQQLQGLISIFAEEMVVGDDYINKRVIGSENVCKVHFFKKLANYSTSKILEHKNE